jgi:hypothetical protein
MRKTASRMLFLGCSLFLATSAHGQGQPSAFTDPSPATAPAAVVVVKPSPPPVHVGRIGVGVKMSLLGGGIEAATRVTRRSNLRAGFNMVSYSRTFNKDGIAYGGQLGFKTIEAHYDIFPFAGRFHVSPGVLAYIGDPITANLRVPGGQSFSLGGKQYFSDGTARVTGTGKIDFNRAAPTITVGWGNLVPRNRNHISVPFEIGVAFQGTPKATLNLAGNVCDSVNANCRSVASDPTVQSRIQSEQTKLNNSMSLFKAYPIISIGLGYRF